MVYMRFGAGKLRCRGRRYGWRVPARHINSLRKSKGTLAIHVMYCYCGGGRGMVRRHKMRGCFWSVTRSLVLAQSYIGCFVMTFFMSVFPLDTFFSTCMASYNAWGQILECILHLVGERTVLQVADIDHCFLSNKLAAAGGGRGLTLSALACRGPSCPRIQWQSCTLLCEPLADQ